MLEQWKCWDECMQTLKGYEVYSCVGNHDNWWAAPSKKDEMYGVTYAAKEQVCRTVITALKRKTGIL
ncbi:hypothetical protein LWM68_09065 [Niabella sp. W65]|nr:hypothetical protein [Niabella sp. W65]MCH7362905.1 hypothetical protein [Niabella sp. W65]ULT38854.1 hypothetical protein KRR40_27750 [Niabella sp. I65]